MKKVAIFVTCRIKESSLALSESSSLLCSGLEAFRPGCVERGSREEPHRVGLGLLRAQMFLLQHSVMCGAIVVGDLQRYGHD